MKSQIQAWRRGGHVHTEDDDREYTGNIGEQDYFQRIKQIGYDVSIDARRSRAHIQGKRGTGIRTQV
jgi:hypothetical protein